MTVVIILLNKLLYFNLRYNYFLDKLLYFKFLFKIDKHVLKPKDLVTEPTAADGSRAFKYWPGR